MSFPYMPLHLNPTNSKMRCCGFTAMWLLPGKRSHGPHLQGWEGTATVIKCTVRQLAPCVLNGCAVPGSYPDSGCCARWHWFASHVQAPQPKGVQGGSSGRISHKVHRLPV